jgi:hypothetical protein
MEVLKGYATKLLKKETASPDEIIDYNHAWKVLFAYEGEKMALREVGLGPLPGKFPSMAIRKVIMDKHAFSEESIEQIVHDYSGPVSTCVFCKLAFGSKFDDPNFGPITVTRNRRNKFYCNTCDLFLRVCPGQVTLELPVMVVDVKHSRKIRHDSSISLYQYSQLISDFQCLTAAIIQKNLGMVLNTVGDAVIGIWPSGFVPIELREKYGWDDDHPAKISAKLAIKAAQELSNSTPLQFTGTSLPFKGALDSTEMVIFSVQASEKLAQLEYSDLDEALAGSPLIDDSGNLLIGIEPGHEATNKHESQRGPTSIDIAGEAIERSSELSSHDDLSVGDFAITQRLDKIAGDTDHKYVELPGFDIPFRIIKPK